MENNNQDLRMCCETSFKAICDRGYEKDAVALAFLTTSFLYFIQNGEIELVENCGKNLIEELKKGNI